MNPERSVNSIDLPKARLLLRCQQEGNCPTAFSFVLHHYEFEFEFPAQLNQQLTYFANFLLPSLYTACFLYTSSRHLPQDYQESVTMAAKGKTADTCHFDIVFTKNVPHILEKIFLSMDFQSLNKCFEVNNAWNALLTSESFQSKAKALFYCEIMRDKNLMQPSFDGNIKEVRRLLSIGMVNINCEDDRKSTPLLVAASNGHEDVVKLLLDNGADPDKADRYKWTALHWATYYKEEDVVKLLLERGAQPNKSDRYGTTPLHKAAFYIHTTGIAKCLLDNGAEPNRADNRGFTPLHEAARWEKRCGPAPT